jgi:peptidoglycan/LPS O-acetylase OafA/YrhL
VPELDFPSLVKGVLDAAECPAAAHRVADLVAPGAVGQRVREGLEDPGAQCSAPIGTRTYRPVSSAQIASPHRRSSSIQSGSRGRPSAGSKPGETLAASELVAVGLDRSHLFSSGVQPSSIGPDRVAETAAKQASSAPALDASMPTRSTHLNGLDTLRAAAILLVLAYHYQVFVSHTDTFGVTGRIGWVGVDLFFALSGYLIGNQIVGALCGGGMLSLRHFYARRLLRTLPAYYAVLTLYAAWPWFRGASPLPPIWKFLTFTQNYQLMPGTAFSHAWSLCIEEQFYLLLPAAAVGIAATRRPAAWIWLLLGAGAAGGMCARAWLWHTVVDGVPDGPVNHMRYIYYASVCRADELLSGVALAVVRHVHPKLWQRLTARGNVTLFAGLAATAVTFALLLRDERGLLMTVLGYPMLGVSFCLLILAAVSERSALRNVPVPGAARLAVWSYAIYLTHKQVCILGSGILATRGHEPGSFVTIAVLAAACLAAGWLLHRAVEAPFLALRERFAPAPAGA